jgi:hypothetical protein
VVQVIPPVLIKRIIDVAAFVVAIRVVAPLAAAEGRCFSSRCIGTAPMAQSTTVKLCAGGLRMAGAKIWRVNLALMRVRRVTYKGYYERRYNSNSYDYNVLTLHFRYSS